MNRETKPGKVQYIRCAETAKIVRTVLKRAFPGQKFSVRSHVYSMGASIYVHWTDGPSEKEVHAVIGPLAGQDFDGIDDSHSERYHWLAPDGTVSLASAKSQSYKPAEYEVPHHPDAVLVRLGADHIIAMKREGGDA